MVVEEIVIHGVCGCCLRERPSSECGPCPECKLSLGPAAEMQDARRTIAYRKRDMRVYLQFAWMAFVEWMLAVAHVGAMRLQRWASRLG